MTPDDDTLIILDGLARRSRLGMILLALAILFGIAGLLLLPGCNGVDFTHSRDTYQTVTTYPDGRIETKTGEVASDRGRAWYIVVNSQTGIAIKKNPDGTFSIEYNRGATVDALAGKALDTAKSALDTARAFAP